MVLNVTSCLESISESLTLNRVNSTLNQVRNYSFQKKFFDWEEVERWFGISIYQSITFAPKDRTSFNIGLWYWSEYVGVYEKRVYLSSNSTTADSQNKDVFDLFNDSFY